MSSSTTDAGPTRKMTRKTTIKGAEPAAAPAAPPREPVVLLSGLLSKRGRLRKSWKARKFVLLEDNGAHFLEYYENRLVGAPKLKGRVPLDGYVVEDALDIDRKFPFQLAKEGARTYYFSAPSSTVRTQWMRQFRACLQPNIEDWRAGPTPVASDYVSVGTEPVEDVRASYYMADAPRSLRDWLELNKAIADAQQAKANTESPAGVAASTATTATTGAATAAAGAADAAATATVAPGDNNTAAGAPSSSAAPAPDDDAGEDGNAVELDADGGTEGVVVPNAEEGSEGEADACVARTS